MCYSRTKSVTTIALVLLILVSATIKSIAIPASKRLYLKERITSTYPEQLTNPEKKNRKTFSQFGYNLSEFSVPLFPITKFIKQGKFGQQSYSRPNRWKEKNGAIYTCKGGFIDVSHMRAAIDWTVYLTMMILADDKDVALPSEAGTLTVSFRHLDKLTEDDIASMAQKIAFERLVWHEVASWHYHPPYHFIGEQSSTFTPEDTYSNFLGTTIGKKVALRMLKDTTHLSYSAIATDEIQKAVAELQPVKSKKESKMAYDLVDANKQRKLPESERNKDVWYDSRIVFRDQRHVFKRNLNIGPEIVPWLVPESDRLTWSCNAQPEVLHVPQTTTAGSSLYNYYTFTITPDPDMFYNKRRHKQLHPPFGTFTTEHYGVIMEHIRKQMEEVLLAGFDRRDGTDPTVYYTNANKVLLK